MPLYGTDGYKTVFPVLDIINHYTNTVSAHRPKKSLQTLFWYNQLSDYFRTMSRVLKREQRLNRVFQVRFLRFHFCTPRLQHRVGEFLSVWHPHPNSLTPPGSVHPLPATDVAPGKCDSQREGQFRRRGRSPARAAHPDASRGACAPFCKFLEEALGYVEKCFVAEERAARRREGGPRPVVSRAATAGASVLHAERASGEEGA